MADFPGYLDGVASQATDAIAPNPIEHLAGADVYAQANSYTLVESLRIDSAQLGPFGIHPKPGSAWLDIGVLVAAGECRPHWKVLQES